MDDMKELFPSSIAQTNAPVEVDGQDRRSKIQSQVDMIMETFREVLPSNYSAEVSGPLYMQQFRAAAEVLAEFQITAQEVFADSTFDYTRPEFLFQILGGLVFPDADVEGVPSIEGDLTYRTFLRTMVELLLQGSTSSVLAQGLSALSDANFELIERGLSRSLMGEKSGWGPEDQFTFEINVSQDTVSGEQTFPEAPFTLLENVRLVLRVLKPAHTLYDYRHLFRESLGEFFSDDLSWSLEDFQYEDMRQYTLGAKELTGSSGITWTDRTLFSDPTRDFSAVEAGSSLVITSGPNSIHVGGLEGASGSTDALHVGRYTVQEVRAFPVGDDPVERAYTTSSGLSGTATVVGNAVIDPVQDFGPVQEGEILTFTEGPNAGAYRLKYLGGLDGGPVGLTTIPTGVTYTKVIVAPSLVRLDRRMKVATTGQSYTLSLDRLGILTPHSVSGEDVSSYFYL